MLTMLLGVSGTGQLDLCSWAACMDCICGEKTIDDRKRTTPTMVVPAPRETASPNPQR